MTNDGIAPLYVDAWVAIDGVRSGTTLKGIAPGETRSAEVATGAGGLTIACDRLLPGQQIGFEAHLSGR